ncbi:MAG: phage holin family protein [Candidatus Saccharimonadales bacterium]
MKQQFTVFLVRWLLNTFGIWVTIRLFGTGLQPSEIDAGFGAYFIAGLIFSIVNTILRPIVVILSLPAILLTLGLFTFIINGLMVYISLELTPGIQMTFWYSVLTGIVLSLINYIMSSLMDYRYEPKKEEKIS